MFGDYSYTNHACDDCTEDIEDLNMEFAIENNFLSTNAGHFNSNMPVSDVNAFSVQIGDEQNDDLDYTDVAAATKDHAVQLRYYSSSGVSCMQKIVNFFHVIFYPINVCFYKIFALFRDDQNTPYKLRNRGKDDYVSVLQNL